jgi:release factor glutamine methyltransferase
LLSRVFSLAVSNPPYVSSGDIRRNLEPEVADHEPSLALDGGDSGP